MQKRTWIAGAVAGLALAGIGIFFWNGSSSQKAAAQASRGDQRVVGVTAAKAVKQLVPVRLEALGTVTTMAAVAVKPRVDSEIIAVKFEDGQRVKQGDVLFVLDSRSIETEIRRVEAVIVGAEAQFEQASRDVVR
jgi:membrane fusion protein, multidrug efflux system